MKATPEEFELHRRLLAGDSKLSAVVADKFFEPLARAIQTSFAKTHEHTVQSVAADAILEYILRPQRYDPEKRALLAYLYMDARGNLLNILQREKRREQLMQNENFDEAVENQSVHGNKEKMGDQILIDQELNEKLDKVIPDPIERKVLALMMDGEHRTKVFVEVMGIQHLHNEDQCADVKRMKDRIKARLRRYGRTSFL